MQNTVHQITLVIMSLNANELENNFIGMHSSEEAFDFHRTRQIFAKGKFTLEGTSSHILPYFKDIRFV